MKSIKRIISILASVTAILTFATNAFSQMSKEERDNMSPQAVLAEMLAGNARFVTGELSSPEIKQRIAAGVKGQFPKAYVLSCVDSRVPVEQVFDMRIGDIFVGRVAGNIVNVDQLGSMEFASKLAGVKLVMVLGHSNCGAVKGACDGVELGNLSALLAKIKPAVANVKGHEEEGRNSKNAEFVSEVVESNVRNVLNELKKSSPTLVELESAGALKIVGGIYDLASGKVELLD